MPTVAHSVVAHFRDTREGLGHVFAIDGVFPPFGSFLSDHTRRTSFGDQSVRQRWQHREHIMASRAWRSGSSGVMDFINQTSDKPPYFLKQRSSRWFITTTVAISIFCVSI